MILLPQFNWDTLIESIKYLVAAGALSAGGKWLYARWQSSKEDFATIRLKQIDDGAEIRKEQREDLKALHEEIIDLINEKIRLNAENESVKTQVLLKQMLIDKLKEQLAEAQGELDKTSG